VIRKFSKRLAEAQSVRFLVAGGFNTLFGIADTFLVLKMFLLVSPTHPKSMGTAAIAVSSVVNIAVSFLTYKWFVFKTKGNYVPEFLRSLTIYLPTIAVSTLLVAPLTAVFQRWTGNQRGSVYMAMAAVLSFTIVFSFFGHKRVTFKQKSA
jgi:putative flippase GtrA